jgi:hypothetical protein
MLDNAASSFFTVRRRDKGSEVQIEDQIFSVLSLKGDGPIALSQEGVFLPPYL